MNWKEILEEHLPEYCKNIKQTSLGIASNFTESFDTHN